LHLQTKVDIAVHVHVSHSKIKIMFSANDP